MSDAAALLLVERVQAAFDSEAVALSPVELMASLHRRSLGRPTTSYDSS